MAKNEILILSRYGQKGASSRLRTWQYIPGLESHGYSVTVSPFFDDEALEYFYLTGHKKKQHVLRAFLRRFRILLKVRSYDLVWVEKELFPFLPGWFERWLSRLDIPYIVDFDDAIFHGYDQSPSQTIRYFFSNKLSPLISGASSVTVGNSYLAEYMLKNGAKAIDFIPTVVDDTKYQFLPEECNDEFRIGWIGTPLTSRYLEVIKEPLETLAKRKKIRLVTIGASSLPNFNLPLEQHPWTKDTEAMLLSSINLGVMPLFDNFWERGKCGYKLIQYMACGRAVIASPVGVNVDIVKDHINGYLAEDGEWLRLFEKLIDEPELRARMGLVNRELVERVYSLRSQTEKLVSLFDKCCRC